MSRGVIKADDARHVSRGMLGLELRDIAAQAEGLMRAARAEAERIVSEARRQAESLREQAARESMAAGREQGLAEGRREGEQTALLAARTRLEEEQAALISALSGLLTELNEKRSAFLTAARRDVVVLAVAMARRLSEKLALMEEIAPTIAAEACAEAVELIGEATQVVIRVHPSDLAAVSELTTQLAESLQSGRHLRLVEDESIGRGGVRLETPDCTLDAGLTERIERIADELVTAWRERLKEWSVKP